MSCHFRSQIFSVIIIKHFLFQFFKFYGAIYKSSCIIQGIQNIKHQTLYSNKSIHIPRPIEKRITPFSHTCFDFASPSETSSRVGAPRRALLLFLK